MYAMKTFDSEAKENVHPNRGDIGTKPFRTTFSPFEEAEEYQTAKPSYQSTAESAKSKPAISSSHGSQNVSARPHINPAKTIKPRPTQGQQLRSIAIQATFGDSDIFPPLDYRRCIRCGKNDAIAPGVCRYQERVVSHSDRSDMISLKNRDKISSSHAYKLDPHASEGDLFIFKPHESSQKLSIRDSGVQTIVGLAEVRLMNRGPLRDFAYVDAVLLSPKD